MNSPLGHLALLTLLLAAGLFGSATPGWAGDSAAERKFHVGASLGWTYVNDTTLDGPDLFLETGQVTFNLGRRLDVRFGYDFADWLAVELETGIVLNTMELKGIGGGIGGFDGNMGFYQVPVLANAVFRMPTHSRFKPYIGGGVGGVGTQLSGDAALSGTDEDFGLAWQGFAGVDYQLSSRLELGLVYKCLGAGERSFGALRATLGATQTHSLSVSVLFKF